MPPTPDGVLLRALWPIQQRLVAFTYLSVQVQNGFVRTAIRTGHMKRRFGGRHIGTRVTAQMTNQAVTWLKDQGSRIKGLRAARR